jgi:hypothetical protein
MRALLGTTALLAILLPTAAQAQSQQVNVFWGEDASCSTWSKSASNKAIRAQYDFWVRGFVSGHNYANPARQVKIGVFPVSADLYLYLDQYCRDNPSLSFIGGAIRLVEELRDLDVPSSKPAAAPSKPPARKAPATK